MIRRFARPYAKAMMEIVKSPAESEALIASLRGFEKARRGAQDLADFYSNPSIEVAAKVRATEQIAARLEIQPLGVRFLDVLVRNNRINDLGAILDAWHEMLNEQTGISTARVRSAHALDEAEKQKLRSALERRFGGRIELQLTTDPALLGGFVAQVGSEIYDASVLGQITKFRTSLT